MRSTEKERCRDVRYAHEKAREKPVTAEVRRNPAFGGRKAGEDLARSLCPEEHPGTQGCLRQEARPTSSGSDAAAKEASQVNRQRSTVHRRSAVRLRARTR